MFTTLLSIVMMTDYCLAEGLPAADYNQSEDKHAEPA